MFGDLIRLSQFAGQRTQSAEVCYGNVQLQRSYSCQSCIRDPNLSRSLVLCSWPLQYSLPVAVVDLSFLVVNIKKWVGMRKRAKDRGRRRPGRHLTALRSGQSAQGRLIANHDDITFTRAYLPCPLLKSRYIIPSQCPSTLPRHAPPTRRPGCEKQQDIGVHSPPRR